ncbi:MAG: hypothetical protein EPN38_08135 [Rhodanobacteraceae bacterium]|nr:MAG: hypothetical protein EPN38_08135 [Rhodanobacteraceae bacterium]
MNASVAPAAALFPLLIGIPDDRKATVTLRPNGALGYELAGNARIATDLPPAIKRRLLRVVFGPGVPLRIPPTLHARPHVNAIGDADVCGAALRTLEQHLVQHGAACFNHPSAVLGTARDRAADKLAAIDGIWAPRTLRLRIEEPADVLAAVEREGLRWPLILRTAGTHSGKATVRLDAPADVRAGLRGLAWGGRDLYLTQYVDYRDPDGHFRKLRLALVGHEVFIRHHIVADHWMIHFRDRDLRHLPEEEHALETFHDGLLPQLASRLRAVADAIDLDYTGIDCSLRPDGRLLVFEVNPLMDILTNTMPEPNCWDAPVRRIGAALGPLLTDPARWRHPVQATAGA